MAYVKLDTRILDSTLWLDREAREVFITALLMAEPRERTEPSPQLAVRSLELTGWAAPAGWYGWIAAAGVGIVRRAAVEMEAGLAALERLGSPEPDSRSQDHEGRRLVRVEGGYLMLNYMRYRDHDHSAAQRQRRLRERRRMAVTMPSNGVTTSRHGVTSRDEAVTSRIAYADADKGGDTGTVVVTDSPSGSKKGRARSRRAPPEWKISEELATWIKGKFPGVHLDTLRAWTAKQIERFRNHEFGTPRSDWDATFRNWVLRCMDDGELPAGVSGRTVDEEHRHADVLKTAALFKMARGAEEPFEAFEARVTERNRRRLDELAKRTR